jgi:hypothetical protein
MVLIKLGKQMVLFLIKHGLLVSIELKVEADEDAIG